MPAVSFSIADASHAAAISALTRHVIRTVNAKDYTLHEVENACAKFSPEYFRDKINSRVFYIATLGEEIIGQASFGESKIHSLFVHPAFQSQGIGGKLLGRLEIAAFGAMTEVILVSSTVAGKGFYEKFGFSFVSSENSQLGALFLMEKRLTVK